MYETQHSNTERPPKDDSSSFKTEELKNMEPYLDEVCLLRKEVEKLKNEKIHLELQLSGQAANYDEELSMVKTEHENKLRGLENKYKQEMSDLRIYFENSYSDFLRQLTDNRYGITLINSTSEDNTGENDINLLSRNQSAEINFDDALVISDTASKLEVIDESKIKIKENIDKDLKNFMKAYHAEMNKFKQDLENRKDNEIRELKRKLETKYLTIIDTLQTENNQFLYEKAINDKVVEIQSLLEEEKSIILQDLQKVSDEEFLYNVENDKKMVEETLKSKFQDELNQLNNEWKTKFEDLLSDILVDSAVKSITREINSHSPINTSRRFNESNRGHENLLKEKYECQLVEMRNKHKDEINGIILNFEQNIRQLNDEKELLARRVEEITETNEYYEKEIENLKVNFVKELKTLQSCQELDVQRMEHELSKMKFIHESEVTRLKESNVNLEKKIREIKENEETAENLRRQKVISVLQQEIKDLILNEQNGECITWPSELAALEQLFVQKFQMRNDFGGKTTDLSHVEEELAEQNTTKCYSDGFLDLNEILKERDGLRKINVALHGVVKVFTKYLTNCEDELNNTLIGELIKLDSSKKNANNYDSTLCDFSTVEENVKKVHFAPNVSEFLDLLSEDRNLETSKDHNISVIESELNTCLERLKNEAAAVLYLTAGKKQDAEEVKEVQDEDIQTEIYGDEIIGYVQKIRVQEEYISKQDMIVSEMNREVARLMEKINELESIEGYGEDSGERFVKKFGKRNANEIDYDNGEDFCSKCDKICEDAKKEIEDRDAQLQAAGYKLKSLNQFLERQTAEREHERLEYDKHTEVLNEQLKEQKKDFAKLETEVITLRQQIKKLSSDLEQSQHVKDAVEVKLKATNVKIAKLTDLNAELEKEIQKKSKQEKILEAKMKEKDVQHENDVHDLQILIEQLKNMPEGNMKQFEELNEQHVISSTMIEQIKGEIYEVEKLVVGRTRELENTYLLTNSINVTSSPSEDVSVCDRIRDCLRVISPGGSDQSSSPIHVPINQLACLHDKIERLIRAEEAALKKIHDQDMQLNKLSNSLAELELERLRLQESLNERDSEMKQLTKKVQSPNIVDSTTKITGTDKRRKLHNDSQENVESSTDSDVSRHAVSNVPHYISVISYSEKPLINSEANEVSDLPVVNYKKFAVEESTSTGKVQELEKLDSGEYDSSALVVEQLSAEQREPSVPLLQTSGTDSYCDEDQKSFLELEAEFLTVKSELENNLEKAKSEVVDFAKRCYNYEQQVSILTMDLEKKNQHIEELNCELNEMKNQCITLTRKSEQIDVLKNKMEKQEKELDDQEKKIRCLEDLKTEMQRMESEFDKKQRLNTEENRKREEQAEKMNRALVKERIDAQLKCEELARSLEQTKELLNSEMLKSKGLACDLEAEKKLCAQLEQKISQLENELQEITIQRKEEVERLTDLQSELELAKRDAESGDKSSCPVEISVLRNRSDSLRNLTEKVQKEVEIAEEMDNNILRSLESDSKALSFIEELMKISPLVSENLKRILLKTLQEGPQELTDEEKNILIECCDLREQIINVVKHFEEIQMQLLDRLELEQKSNKELFSESNKKQMELNRLEMILSYYDERMSFLFTKLDEYRNKVVRAEIECTCEKTSRHQVEMNFDNYKKDMSEKQNQDSKKIEEIMVRLNETMNENFTLKYEVDSLRNRVEILNAELNSVKVLSQYHSDSESDFSRCLTPLKIRLNDIQDKYSTVKCDLERKKNELEAVKCSLNSEHSNNQRLETLYKVTMAEKGNLQKELVDLKMKFDDLNWQKEKVDERLKAAELAEMKRRKLRLCKDDVAKKEHEAVKEERHQLENECYALKKNLIKIKDAFRSLHNDWKKICKETQNIFGRMMKAESNQRMLVYQKIFLVTILQKYKEELNTITASRINTTPHFYDYIYVDTSSNLLTPVQRFKSIVHCIRIIYRIKFIIKRRKSSNHAKIVNYFKVNLPGVRIHPWCTISPPEFVKEETYTYGEPIIKKLKTSELKENPDSGLNTLSALYSEFAKLHDTYVFKG